jgi:hypothetical protein
LRLGASFAGFVRSLKQTLKTKTFVETSAKAVRTQVWTALIARLVLQYLQVEIDLVVVDFRLAALFAATTVLLSRPMGMAGRSISG